MKIAVVCPYDVGVPGGVQQLCADLVLRLREAGDEAALIGPGRADSVEHFTSIGSTVRVRANDSVAPVALAPRTWSRVKEAIDGFDVVHVHEPLVPATGWAAMATDLPRVLTFHADAPRWARWFYRAMPKLGKTIDSAVLTAVSDAASDAIPARWGLPRVIPNAIDVASFESQSERLPLRIAFLGRDEPRKGLDVALEAFHAVRARHPGAELIVMGALRDRAPEGVRFLGFVTGEEKKRHLASSSVFVAPNTGGESFGIVLVEAMAAGCAVVASDLPAFKAVLADAGVLVPVGNAHLLAESISRLLESETASARLREAGRERVRRYDWDNVVGLYRAAYDDAVTDW